MVNGKVEVCIGTVVVRIGMVVVCVGSVVYGGTNGVVVGV